jgi:hypothetical protein
MKYQILCQISGGITGYRQAMLKENDKVWETDDEQKARNKAKNLNGKTNDSYSCASFSYSVQEQF